MFGLIDVHQFEMRRGDGVTGFEQFLRVDKRDVGHLGIEFVHARLNYPGDVKLGYPRTGPFLQILPANRIEHHRFTEEDT